MIVKSYTVRPRFGAWMGIALLLQACTQSSLDLGGPLGDECEGETCTARLDLGDVDAGRPDLGADLGGGGEDAGREDAAPLDLGPDAAGSCAPGQRRACGPDTGACEAGEETCGDDGAWGACEGAVGPTAEACDGVDNDCNGEVDDGLTEPCGGGLGACAPGIRTCVEGIFGACEGEVLPAPEVCNAADDDCDGATDEDILQGCEPAAGVCAAGSQACSEGDFGECVQPAGPIPELCDGADNDCDEAVDEALVDQPCGVEVGACRPGVRSCVDGLWGLCVGGVQPTVESCNGVDDDCDGATDEAADGEALARPCGSDVGNCTQGVERCVDGAFTPCDAAVLPVDEACNGQDDDCDGATDEDLEAVPCSSDVGECRPGVQTCEGGELGECRGAVEAVEEDCNGLDDDCDGATDEAVTRQCGTDVGVCEFGEERCVEGEWGECQGAIIAVPEFCDGLDDDCDGTPDVNADGSPAACQLNNAVGRCEMAACLIDGCAEGWQDINAAPDDGCERGCQVFGEIIRVANALADSAVRVRAGAGSQGAAFIASEAAGQASLGFILDGQPRLVGDRNITYRDLDLSPVDAGWVVVGLGDDQVGQTRATFSRRDFGGENAFGGLINAPDGRQIAVAGHANLQRFLIALVRGEDARAGGALEIYIYRADEGGARPVGPIPLQAAGASLIARPEVISVPDGFVVVGSTVGAEPRLNAWFVDAAGEVRGTAGINLVGGAVTDIGVTTRNDVGRIVARSGAGVLYQDFVPSVAGGRFGGGQMLAHEFNARDLDIVPTFGGYVLTWVDVGDSQPRGLLLGEDGAPVGEELRPLGALRSGADSLSMYGDLNGALSSAIWLEGTVVRATTVQCN